MTLKEYVAFFEKTSENSNKVYRQLAFAAFAIVWLFKKEDKAASIFFIPKEYETPIIYFVLSLTADLLHYFIPTIIHGMNAFWLQIVKGKQETDIYDMHILLLVPAWACYFAKMILLIIGYIKLLSVILNNFR
jgi:hypothetical protein